MVVHPKSESYGFINYTHRVGYFVFIHLKYIPYSGKKLIPPPLWTNQPNSALAQGRLTNCIFWEELSVER